MGLFQSWLNRQEEKKERREVERRNAERRRLCVEFAHNKARQGAIIARLAELSGESNLKATAERIGFDLEGICRRTQADVIRRPISECCFPRDVKHFRREYCDEVES